MSKRWDVLQAVKELLVFALPGVVVQGLDGEDVTPERIGPNGRAVIEAGDPGRPTIDLNPPTYNYQHQIPVTLDVSHAPGSNAEEAVDALIDQIATEIEADRTLGGLVDYLDATAPPAHDEYLDGAPVIAGASLTIVASYSSTRPL